MQGLSSIPCTGLAAPNACLVPKQTTLTLETPQVPWAMPSEIFPSSLRAKGVALATCSNWLNNFIIGLITPPLVINTGFGAYTFFAIFCFLSLIWTFYFVPETKGRTLEAMDQYVFIRVHPSVAEP